MRQVEDMALLLSDSSWAVRSAVLRVWASLRWIPATTITAMVTALRTYLPLWSPSETNEALSVCVGIGANHCSAARFTLSDLFHVDNSLRLSMELTPSDVCVSTLFCTAAALSFA
jgi:hypothetical protein